MLNILEKPFPILYNFSAPSFVGNLFQGMNLSFSVFKSPIYDSQAAQLKPVIGLVARSQFSGI